jgi:hypothetical protein
MPQEIPSDVRLALAVTQSPTWGLGSTCHAHAVPAAECGEGEPSSQEQTVTHDRTLPWGR